MARYRHVRAEEIPTTQPWATFTVSPEPTDGCKGAGTVAISRARRDVARAVKRRVLGRAAHSARSLSLEVNRVTSIPPPPAAAP